MRKNIILCLLIFTNILLSNKIGLVDPQQVLQQYEAARTAQIELEKEGKRLEA